MKKILLIIVLGSMIAAGVCAQGYPVIDITSIIASIENGYTMVQQLHAMYDNIKTSYDQLQQQIKNFESFDFNTLDAGDPLGAWRSINTYADRLMTYQDNIETILNTKNIKVGSGTCSLTDIFTTPPNQTAQSLVMDGVHFVSDPLETKLSPQEKAAFHRKYGMSFGHFMRFNYLGEKLQKKALEVAGYSDNLRKNLAEDRERLNHLSKDVLESKSTVQQQQMNNAMISIMAQDTKTQAELLAQIAEQLAANLAQAQIAKQAMQNELNINSLDLTEGFLKMLDEASPLDYYK